MENEAYKKVLDSEDFTTGGGSAAALAGAMAAALAAMVAKLSLKKDYGLPSGWYSDIAVEADNLKKELLMGAGEDIEAFALVKEAYALPKDSAEEKYERTARIRKGFIAAAWVPARNGERCRRVLELSTKLVGNSNPDAVSDLEVALALAKTGLKGCVANIEINLSSIKDPRVLKELEVVADSLRKNF